MSPPVATTSPKSHLFRRIFRECELLSTDAVLIKLVSSLTPDDENVCAPALLQHFVSMLGQLPIAYAIRIETSDQVFQHSTPVCPAPSPPDRRQHSSEETAFVPLMSN